MKWQNASVSSNEGMEGETSSEEVSEEEEEEEITEALDRLLEDLPLCPTEHLLNWSTRIISLLVLRLSELPWDKFFTKEMAYSIHKLHLEVINLGGLMNGVEGMVLAGTKDLGSMDQK